MDPATVALVSIVAQLALKFGLPAAQAFVELFHKTVVTKADWDQTFLTATKSYDEYIAQAQAAATPAP